MRAPLTQISMQLAVTAHLDEGSTQENLGQQDHCLTGRSRR